MFRESSPRYTLDITQHAVELPGVEKVNFKKLFEVLKSKDPKALTDQEWMFDGKFRFLDGEALPG